LVEPCTVSILKRDNDKKMKPSSSAMHAIGTFFFGVKTKVAFGDKKSHDTTRQDKTRQDKAR
jgi:hypothetical protein